MIRGVTKDDAIDAIHLPAPRYTIGEAHIAELKQAADKAPAEIIDRKTRQANHEAKMLCVKARTETEKRRQALKRESLEYGKRVDAAAKVIESSIREIEQPLVSRIETWDAEQKRLREAEEQRLAALRAKIDTYRQAPFTIFNAAVSSEEVRSTLNAFLTTEASDLEELAEEGAAVLQVAKDKAREIADGIIAMFDDRERAEKERRALEEERKALEVEKRKLEEMLLIQEEKRYAPLNAFAGDLRNWVERCHDKSPEDIADMIGDLQCDAENAKIVDVGLKAEADKLLDAAQKEMLSIQHEKIAEREAEAERIDKDKKANNIAAKAFLDAYAEAFDDVIGTDEDTVLHKIIAGNVAHCKWTGPAHVEPIEEEGEA